MRTRTLLFPALALLIGGLLFATDALSKGRNFYGHTSENGVKKACGKDLQSGGGAFGCTKCDKEGCTDWSCNHSGKGRQGCWVEPIGKVVPGGKGGKGLGNRATGVKSVGTGSRKGMKETGVTKPTSSGLSHKRETRSSH